LAVHAHTRALTHTHVRQQEQAAAATGADIAVVAPGGGGGDDNGMAEPLKQLLAEEKSAHALLQAV